jgi:hypothetical protein
MARMQRVFLSHGARDAKTAAAIARALRKHGVETFETSKAEAEAKYDRQTVKSAIRRTDAFVLILSAPEIATSSWVGYELGMAVALDQPVLMLLSHKHAAAELPPDMVGLPIAPLDPANPEAAAREIVDRLLAPA